MILYSYNKQYPKPLPETISYETTENPEDHPNVSGLIWETNEWITVEVNSSDLTDEQLAELGYIRVSDPLPDFDPELEYVEWDGQQYIVLKNIKGQTSKPAHDPVRENCIWRRGNWLIVPSKKAIHREVKWIRIRNRRNYLLSITDELARQHIENNQQIPNEWVEYRDTLRSIPNVYETGEIDDADLVVFPEMPYQFEQPLYKDFYDKLNDENVIIEALKVDRNTLYQNLLDIKWKQLRNIENQISDSELDAQVQYLEDLIDEHMKDEITQDV